MDRARRVIALAAVLTYLPVVALVGQTGRLAGRVTDSAGGPLAGAVVSVEGTPFRASAGPSGNYELRGIPAGSHTVRARLIGYTPSSASLAVRPGAETRHDFVLTRSVVRLAPIDVVVGSRARHTAAEELAVPVDVYGSEKIGQIGSTETSEVLARLSPSVNFPRQSVADASDIVRPFTLRGLSPDHALVLVNGWRRHRTALVHNFAAGM